MSNEEKENVCHLVVNNYSDTRKSIDREQEAIIIKRKNSVYSSETYKKYGNAKLIKSEISKAVLSSADSDTTFNEKKNYHIAVCQDGKFVVTFDTENLQIKILKNISNSPYKDNNQSTSDKINETIIQFKIDGNDEGKEITSNNDEKSGWSIDISNVYTNDTKDCKRKCFIFVAVSRIIDEDMKNMKNTIKKAKERNRTIVIYRIELINGNYVSDRDTKNTIIYKIHGISGICRFVHESRNNEVLSLESDILRFIVLNFDGMRSFDYKDNFKLYKKFNYPEHIKRKLEALDSSEISDCMNLLFSCIYDKYFLIEHYKDNVHLLEVYDLAKMRLETITKRVENSQDKLIRNYNRKNFSISKNKQLLCFTRGFHSINLYFMENGLEAINKKFDGIEEIYLVEFFENDRKLIVIGIGVSEDEENLKLIIWDMYNVVETETIELDDFLTTKNIYTRLTRTSGNLLQIDDKGDVTSIVKRVDRLLKQKQSKMIGKIVSPLPPSPDLSYFKGVKPMVVEIEPWVLGNYKDYKSNSYCLYQNKNGSEIETLQLIVGRSTIQVWHQINSDDKNKSKDELPNKGKPFLEYIWTNGIPVNQEREKTRLRIEKFEYRSNVDFNLTDFCLKVYWYERVSKGVSEDELEIKKDDDIEINKMEKEKDEEPRMERKKDREAIIEMEKDEKNKVERKEKVIHRQDIIDKVNAIRHACKALEFINKRREIKDTVIVAYLLEYYSRHATDSGGWMSTMSKALPLLFKYNYDFISPFNTKYILLYDPKNIKTKDSTFNGTATNLVNGQELNVSMKANFDPTDWNDNPFSFFPTAIVATYYWLNGNFVQRDTFDFWAVEVFTFIGSILLITILQNMLIAFMGGVYEEAATKGRQALLRFRANQIANYEALHHYYFSSHDYDPKYIYYIRRSEHFETWYEDRKNDGPIFKDVEKKSTFAEFVFKDKVYDKFSIWKYDDDDDIKIEIEKFKMMKKSLNDNIENLIKNLEDRKNDNANDNIDIDKKIEQLKAIKN
ncbi:hypothetical protein GLOIN_2v1475233 [Rhizophagus irregularis DAOM 181602=DAOM 197198]|uniref:Ion transport domain-containing protein n=1 Tax=Rhizophagus irregularis (strain DAOM 181602 / DAOM 197198 / MUCL 43194) TaxID=747089 RepID=A0A2P4QDH3_RHIID|nr:hypothetical protein GLOIN_2v1475233 [Rhizophagus irregularis DAOM 181602=DAOM 197198]POG75683.1 hypothetical protein GLOIN_2v1475233 [Rhizophagus irregularis DAOM 181602=DAOM 197198]|eukprot:XP_025182549.1 hypothetical protein GLOIN_2v1475233 [Rhizophagus irregularis DAOM 181602=DAOM 197198]